MARPPFNPNKVDWSGENPGMYLKETADGPFVTLISFFRVVTSTHGKGHAAFMLLDPHGDGRNRHTAHDTRRGWTWLRWNGAM